MTNTSAIEGFQLSAQQLRLWQLQASGRSPKYHTSFSIEIGGAVDVDRLRAAVEAVVSRHEILRTTFQRLPDMAIPVQVISETPSFEFTCEEVLGNGHPADSAPTFDLAKGPLIKACLRRIEPARHCLTITLPSLCGDALTAGLLAGEIARAYQGLSSAEDPAAQVMQYADYAAWQLEAAAGSESDQARRFWTNQAIPASLPLPFEKPSSPDGAFLAGMVSLDVGSAEIEALDRLGRRLECPVADLLLGGWMVLLGRLINQSKIGVAVGSDGRGMAEFKTAAGPYQRFLPITAELDLGSSVESWLGNLAAILRRAYEWQEYFAGKKVELVANTPAFVSPVAFEYTELPSALLAGEVSMRLSDVAAGSDPFRLKLACSRQGASLRAALQFDSAVYDPADAQRLLEEWVTVLESFSSGPSSSLGELQILGPRERQQVTVDFNRTAGAVPETCIHALIEAQAQAQPEACAVACGEKHLSYRELDARAHHLAARLQRQGVGAGVPVALCIDRSLEMLVGILGILKAGGCYVPLDPSYPADRLRFMLDDSRARVLVTRRSVRPPGFEGEIVYLDESGPDVADLRSETLAIKATADTHAYIIYTSGSSGRPKGVPISHRNLVHSTFARMEYYPQKVGKYLLLSSFAFDSSVAGIFWTLCQGGTLVLAPDRAHQDPLEISRLVARHQVTHLLCLPSLYRHLLDCRDEDLLSLQVVVVAGESCPVELVERHRQCLPAVALYNEYGPTEATVWSTVFDCREASPGRPIPIGKPISNASVYVLDPRQQPVPIYCAGEIYIGGKGVAGGYLNRPELDAEKFISNPFASEPGSRLYRTGDLGRFLADGSLEFLGRADQQVKVRGYRIELEEIEAVLRQHRGIREVVVTVDTPAGQRGLKGFDPQTLAETLEDLSGAENLLSQIEKEPTNGAPAATSNGNGAAHHLGQTQGGAAVPPSHDSWVQRRPAFEVTVEIRKAGFIAPPRPTQRQWLINRAVAELSDDLETLDGLSRRFVPGADLSAQVFTEDRAQARLTDDEIIQDWHAPLMKAMAEAITVAGGDILEIGFGRGMASSFLQERHPRSHTIIECNDFVIDHHFGPWRAKHLGADIRLVRGKWQDALASLPVFDGIFFQTYPLNEQEFLEFVARSVTFAEHFFPTAAQHLRPGGAFTYLSHEIDSLSRSHQRLLFKHFSSVQLGLQPLRLPADCKDLWWADSMVVVKAIK